MLSLSNGRSVGIRDPLIKRMANLFELEEYASETEDGPLLMLINLVEEYGNELSGLVKELKRRQVADGARHQAQLCFSTVHKSKGLEYDAVQLTDYFIGPESIDRLVRELAVQPVEPGSLAQVMEEVNLLYVALTRVKNVLYMPATRLPHAFSGGAGITPFTEERRYLRLRHLHPRQLTAHRTLLTNSQPLLQRSCNHCKAA